MEENMQNGSVNVLVKKLGLILSGFIFLLPVFFVPALGVSLYVAKVTLLATGLVALFAVFLSSVLSTGSLEVPKVKFLLPIGLLALAALCSSIFSGNITSSIMGSVFDLGTSGLIVMLVFALFMTMLSVKSVSVVGKAMTAFVYSSLAVAAYTLLAAFAASALPASLASRMPLFLLGGAVDSAILFGAAVIISLCTINMTEISKRMKIILSVLTGFSILFIGAANFRPVVVILGVISLVFFVYILSWSVGRPGQSEGETEGDGRRKISLSSLIVLVATIILILGGSSIGGFLSRTMNVEATEVRPNFETTMNLALSSWKQNFALGIGPNNFPSFWAAHKPLEINQTQFWNADFYGGSGFIPTLAVTTGLLGLLCVLVFLFLYATAGVKAIFAQANSGRSRYLSTSSFLVSFYFWIILLFYTPSISILALTFIFTGLFTATLVSQGTSALFRINIFSNPKTNFVSVLSIVVLLILAVAGGYFVWERSVATVAFERGVINYQKTGDIEAVRQSTARAINLVPSDLYWRGLAEVSLIDLNRVLTSVTDAKQVTDAIRTEAQTLIANSVEAAKQAVAQDGRNFQNWFALGRVYEILAGNGIEGSLESSRGAYAEAAALSPNNPSVPLALARLDALSGNAEAARANIAKAIGLKGNYTDAYFTLAQLEVASNNIAAAVRSVEAAAVLDPNNSGLYFQLGVLKYNNSDWNGAVGALERAVILVPDYGNAKYFLGLSYYRLGHREEAVKQFEDVSAANPENETVKTILSDMKAGKPVFQSAAADKSKLPVEER